VLFGGGEQYFRNIYKLDATGKVTQLKSAPMDLAVWHSLHCVDPASGDYLFFSKDGRFYSYDIVKDVWTQQSADIPLFKNPYSNNYAVCIISSPITDYGVSLFVKGVHSTFSTYLYKHAAGTTGISRSVDQPEMAGLSIFPNPMRSKTMITLPGAGQLSIINAQGCVITDLTAKVAGYRVVWHAFNQPSGIYFIKYRQGSRIYYKKILLVR
jgi:hypothetical protein